MNVLYAKGVKGEKFSLVNIALDESFVVEKTQDEKVVVIIDNKKYRLIEKLPQDKSKVITVIGYVEVGKKENQHSNISQNDKRLNGSIVSRIPILQKKIIGHKIIGYIKMENSDSYIAVTINKNIKYVVAATAVIVLFIGILYINVVRPTVNNDPLNISDFINGDKGTGEFTREKTELVNNGNFRWFVNSIPPIKDGKIFIGIDNSKENKYSCVVKVRIDNVIETNDSELQITKPIEIYTSPLLHPNEYIEYGNVNQNLPKGKYNGTATFYHYNYISDNDIRPVGNPKEFALTITVK